jgi:hypothetical protein
MFYLTGATTSIIRLGPDVSIAWDDSIGPNGNFANA